MEGHHDTVLLQEAVEGLAIDMGDVVVDATVGGAGHFGLLLGKLGAEGTLIGIDADADALARAQTVLDGSSAAKPTVHLVENNFRNLSGILEEQGIEKIDKALFDLGWSGFHLTRGRGFSFKVEEPLLMTYGEPQEGQTAADLVNSATEEELSDILHTYGEERFARQIARSIVRARGQQRILTTTQLVAAIEDGVPSWYRSQRLNPSTKSFQALRIAVNDELGALREGITSAMDHLSIGGRVAVITFHSIEDRIVKQLFRDAAYQGQGTLITRKPIVPGDAELVANPRARSAKLRIFERGCQTLPSHRSEFRTNNVYA